MPINGLGLFNGLAGGSQKTHLEVEFEIFFHGINFYYNRGYYCEKEAKKVQRQKSFFSTNTMCFYSEHCGDHYNIKIKHFDHFSGGVLQLM